MGGWVTHELVASEARYTERDEEQVGVKVCFRNEARDDESTGEARAGALRAMLLEVLMVQPNAIRAACRSSVSAPS